MCYKVLSLLLSLFVTVEAAVSIEEDFSFNSISSMIAGSDFVFGFDSIPNGTAQNITGQRRYLRTVATDYSNVDFVFEITATIGAGDASQAAFVGFGEGLGDENFFFEPHTSAYLRQFPDDFEGGRSSFTISSAPQMPPNQPPTTVISTEPAPGSGVHRFQIRKSGDVVVFTIDEDYNGVFTPTYSISKSLSIDLPFLTNTNARLFFGTQGSSTTFDDLRLVVDGPLTAQIENAVEVRFLAAPGKPFQIESSPDVDPPVWTQEGAVALGTGTLHRQTFLTGQNKRIYRVVEGNILTGLVGHYPFNGNANDISGKGNNATVFGPTLATNRFGDVSNGYLYTQKDHYIRTQSATDFPVGTQDFTVSVWFNLQAYPPATDYYSILFANGVVNQFQLGLGPFNCSRALIEFYTGGDIGADCASTTPVTWELGRWYNVQIKRAGTTLSLSLDGQVVGQSQNAQGNNASGDSLNLDFGYRKSNNNHQLYGALDDIRIYNRALSAFESKALTQLRE